VSLALENLFQRKYRFRNADDLYNAMSRRGFKKISDIQEVIEKVKKRRG
jgi:energy-coupling factor transporter transmembrane protein EcfT